MNAPTTKPPAGPANSPATAASAATTPAISAINLTRAETALLRTAAADDGRLTLPDTLKPATGARMLGRLLRDGLASAPEAADAPHRLTKAGYRVIGLTPPRRPRAGRDIAVGSAAEARETPATPTASAAAPASKKALVLALLCRERGATLAELTAATGWLPHTTRAALSRIRTGGQMLVKAARADAATAYHIPAPVAPTAKPSRARKARPTRTLDAANAPATARMIDAAVPVPAAA